MRPIHSKLVKARASLVVDHPFFASVLLPMPMTEDAAAVPTMGTDGESIIYNPEWTDKLTLPETLFTLAHETLHCVFDHMGRRGSRGPNRWNQACDYIINEILIKDRIGSMPHGGLYNPQLTAQGGNTAEGVYKLIPEENEKLGPGQKGGALDSMSDAGSKNGTRPTDKAKMAAASADLKVRVIAAKNAAKMQGKLSAAMERLIDDLVKPRVDWREVLRRFVTERAKVDYSFARPKRRFLAQDLYLPSKTGERMGAIVIAVDCSGSVSKKLLAAFASEINAIREDLRPSGTEIVYFDSKICKVETLSAEEELVIKPVGGGGTAFSPVIKHVNAMEEPPACVVFLTDLYCSDFGKAPDYPVLWCVMEGNESKAPYGEVLQVSEEE